MFDEQKAVIPSMRRSSCDSFKVDSSTFIVDACGLEKSKRNLLAKKDGFVLINLITLPEIHLMWLVAISSNFSCEIVSLFLLQIVQQLFSVYWEAVLYERASSLDRNRSSKMF